MVLWREYVSQGTPRRQDGVRGVYLDWWHRCRPSECLRPHPGLVLAYQDYTKKNETRSVRLVEMVSAPPVLSALRLPTPQPVHELLQITISDRRSPLQTLPFQVRDRFFSNGKVRDSLGGDLRS